MYLVCLDLEGVLVPEIWISLAESTGIEELKLTTRDVADYDVLMKRRLAILQENGLKLPDIQAVIERMAPLPGALELLEKIRDLTEVIILSDTFTQFAKPLIVQLGWPTLFCNTLILNEENAVVDYRLRTSEGKKRSVEAFGTIGYDVIAAGDSYNDIDMLIAARHGILFQPPDGIKTEYPQFPAVYDHEELLTSIVDAMESLSKR